MSTKHVKPQRDPADALQELCGMFAEFDRWWKDEEAEDAMVDGVHSALTHHRLLMEFLDFFAQQHGSFTEQQLRLLGGWVNQAVAMNDELANAVSSAFLGHSRELNVHQVLAPYLSPQAKDKAQS
jgi:hypothetical protein